LEEQLQLQLHALLEEQLQLQLHALLESSDCIPIPPLMTNNSSSFNVNSSKGKLTSSNLKILFVFILISIKQLFIFFSFLLFTQTYQPLWYNNYIPVFDSSY